MQMKDYLLETFQFNDSSNKKLLQKIALLKAPEESIKLFSHLINCQYKWMARIMQDPAANTMSWWDPVYDLDKLAAAWTGSLTPWISYISEHTDEALSAEITFIGFDGGTWAASPKDIALQLNYHSIHHRAQIQTLIRQQGIEPDFVDYIGTRYRKLS
jgi:uncharacterized damage-inducible protein DinB